MAGTALRTPASQHRKMLDCWAGRHGSAGDWMLIGFLRTIAHTIERISAQEKPKKMLGVFYDNPRSCLYRNVIVLRQTPHLNLGPMIFWE